MRTQTKCFLFCIHLGLAGCSDGSAELPAGEPDLRQAAEDGDQAPQFAPGEPYGAGSDPMAHISYLAGEGLQGRNSPSSGLNSAAEYVKAHLANNGLIGPTTGDPNGPYAQTFTMATFSAGAALDDHHELSHGSAYGVELFEEAIYVDERMSPEAHRAAARLRDRVLAKGAANADPRPALERAANADPRPALEGAVEADPRPALKGTADDALAAGALPSVEALLADATLAGTAQNVMGKLPGTGANSNEIILVMAHLDHIGVTSGGVVYNGADDNGSGSAAVLAAVPALVAAQQAGQLNRSVLFLWTAAEEKGLIGAQYFVDHPIAGLGLSSIAGVVNMDMVGRWDDQRLSVIDTTSGGSANYFRTLLQTANASLPDPFNTLNHDIATYIDRQDGWVFLNQGEDVLFLFEGLSNPAGGGSLIPEYHATADDVDKILLDNGGNKPRRVRDLLVEVVKLASNR